MVLVVRCSILVRVCIITIRVGSCVPGELAVSFAYAMSPMAGQLILVVILYGYRLSFSGGLMADDLLP